jgi:CRP/FNR family transcriptional regulator, cyclic AMP receptor protein
MAMTHTPELLAGLDAAERTEVLALASPLTLSPGEVLFRLGADAANLYLIERGLIALTMPMQISGHEEDVLIDERVAGQTVGWSTVIPPHRFTLKATAPVGTELLAFPREKLLSYFATHARVGYVLSQNVAVIVGQRLQVFQAMWLRQMQRMVNLTHA